MALEAVPVGSIPMHSRHFPPMADPDTPTVIALRAFIADTFRGGDTEGLEPTTPLVSSGIIDSVGVLEVVDFVEREFGVRVPAADLVLEHFDSLERLEAYVAAHLPAAAPAAPSGRPAGLPAGTPAGIPDGQRATRPTSSEPPARPVPEAEGGGEDPCGAAAASFGSGLRPDPEPDER